MEYATNSLYSLSTITLGWKVQSLFGTRRIYPTSGDVENCFKRDIVDTPWWRLRVSTAVQEWDELCRLAPHLTHGAEVASTVRSIVLAGSGLHVVEHVCLRREDPK